MESKIDFVIIWVDGNDPEWRKEKSKYTPEKNTDSRDIRYRDWENLKYIFRGIEKYANWVNNVYFVTCGQTPSWMNTKYEKLKLINHKDYIPNQYLPTFSANPIELNLHRIEELSDQFVFFNDDMFIIDYVKPTDFFYKNKPCESAILNPITPEGKDIMEQVFFNNTMIINKHFNKKESIKNNISKWINLKYGKQLLRTLACIGWNNFLGFKYTHLPTSFNKTTFEEIWKEEWEVLDKTSKNKFRSKEDLNQYVIKDWQLASGNFVPRKYNWGKFFEISTHNIDEITNCIEKNKFKTICINDKDIGDKFEEYKNKINNSFQKILPEKSKFEI